MYIEPQDSFEIYLAAAIAKGSSCGCRYGKRKATHVLKAAPVQIKRESTGGKIARCLFAVCTEIEGRCPPVNRGQLNKMLWAYSANKQRGGGKNQQSMAEAVAEHFKRVSQKVTIACFALRLLRCFAPPWPFFSSCSIKLEDADRRTTRACSETHASADFHEVAGCWG